MPTHYSVLTNAVWGLAALLLLSSPRIHPARRGKGTSPSFSLWEILFFRQLGCLRLEKLSHPQKYLWWWHGEVRGEKVPALRPAWLSWSNSRTVELKGSTTPLYSHRCDWRFLGVFGEFYLPIVFETTALQLQVTRSKT